MRLTNRETGRPWPGYWLEKGMRHRRTWTKQRQRGKKENEWRVQREEEKWDEMKTERERRLNQIFRGELSTENKL